MQLCGKYSETSTINSQSRSSEHWNVSNKTELLFQTLKWKKATENVKTMWHDKSSGFVGMHSRTSRLCMIFFSLFLSISIYHMRYNNNRTRFLWSSFCYWLSFFLSLCAHFSPFPFCSSRVENSFSYEQNSRLFSNIFKAVQVKLIENWKWKVK